MQVQTALNQTTKDWHSKSVTLSPSATLRINSVKGLAVRFFATLRMTLLRGSVVKHTNVLNSGLVASDGDRHPIKLGEREAAKILRVRCTQVGQDANRDRFPQLQPFDAI